MKEFLPVEAIMKAIEKQRKKFQSGKKLSKGDIKIYNATRSKFAKEFWFEQK